MSREKVKFALRISPETQQLVKDLCPRDNCQSQNEFIEKAIHFYAGHISAKDSVDFLPPVFAATLKGIVQDSENRTARLLFKLAVEVSIMMNVLASELEINESDLEKLRARCVREVKKTNGSVSFQEAVRYQKGVD